jgi:hypothetical protein
MSWLKHYTKAQADLTARLAPKTKPAPPPPPKPQRPQGDTDMTTAEMLQANIEVAIAAGIKPDRAKKLASAQTRTDVGREAWDAFVLESRIQHSKDFKHLGNVVVRTLKDCHTLSDGELEHRVRAEWARQCRDAPTVLFWRKILKGLVKRNVITRDGEGMWSANSPASHDHKEMPR